MSVSARPSARPGQKPQTCPGFPISPNCAATDATGSLYFATASRSDRGSGKNIDSSVVVSVSTAM